MNPSNWLPRRKIKERDKTIEAVLSALHPDVRTLFGSDVESYELLVKNRHASVPLMLLITLSQIQFISDRLDKLETIGE